MRGPALLLSPRSPGETLAAGAQGTLLWVWGRPGNAPGPGWLWPRCFHTQEQPGRETPGSLAVFPKSGVFHAVSDRRYSEPQALRSHQHNVVLREPNPSLALGS